MECIVICTLHFSLFAAPAYASQALRFCSTFNAGNTAARLISASLVAFVLKYKYTLISFTSFTSIGRYNSIRWAFLVHSHSASQSPSNAFGASLCFISLFKAAFYFGCRSLSLRHSASLRFQFFGVCLSSALRS